MAYSPDVNLEALQYKNMPVWVELENIHPILEIEANELLANGPVLHSTISKGCSAYQHIQV
jgi:hypothetical protein